MYRIRLTILIDLYNSTTFAEKQATSFSIWPNPLRMLSTGRSRD